MRAFVVVKIQPFIEVFWQGFQRLVELRSERRAKKFVQYRTVETLDETVGLRRLQFVFLLSIPNYWRRLLSRPGKIRTVPAASAPPCSMLYHAFGKKASCTHLLIFTSFFIKKLAYVIRLARVRQYKVIYAALAAL